MRQTRWLKSWQFRSPQQEITEIDSDAFTPPQHRRWLSRSKTNTDALNRANTHQIPRVKVFMGSGLKDAVESLRERLAPRADGHGIQVLERAVRTILINKGVTTVWRAA